jgi:hypothetical protein
MSGQNVRANIISGQNVRANAVSGREFSTGTVYGTEIEETLPYFRIYGHRIAREI